MIEKPNDAPSLFINLSDMLKQLCPLYKSAETAK